VALDRVRFGRLWVDAVTIEGALAAVEALLDGGAGGAVFTPNVDHVVVAERDPCFRAAYERADLSLCDGQPLRWASPLLGLRLPERVSGADLFVPLMALAARRRARVYLLGGPPGAAEVAARKLAQELGVVIAGTGAPAIGLEPTADEEAIVAAIAATRPDLVVVCLGAPKGERMVDRARDRLAPAVMVQLGASIDFYVGRIRRAPRWMRRAGLEWLYRLLREPRRLARRYLVQDPAFLLILLRTLLEPRRSRVRCASEAATPRDAHPPGDS
jgi:N-acetylglucosaminyldiphosphoundecaprenol N-acetyl-beta-D-mannosaminyltransferase